MKTFGRKTAINCTAAFERRKAEVTMNKSERHARDAWAGKERRVQYTRPEPNHEVQKIHLEGFLTYLVLAVIVGGLIAVIGSHASSLFATVQTVIQAIGGQ